MNARRAHALLRASNVLLLSGLLAFAIPCFILRGSDFEPVSPPEPVLPLQRDLDRTDAAALAGLANPLRFVEEPFDVIVVMLIGTDRVGNVPDSDTAYLFLPSRRIHVNAYVDAPIREPSSGKEVTELVGWRLKSVTADQARFETPDGERVLPLVQLPASLAGGDARGKLQKAFDLIKRGRLDEAVARFDEAFALRPQGSVVYDVMRAVGENAIVALMNSKRTRLREIGFRLLELAKPGGERVLPLTKGADVLMCCGAEVDGSCVSTSALRHFSTFNYNG